MEVEMRETSYGVAQMEDERCDGRRSKKGWETWNVMGAVQMEVERPEVW